MIYLGRDKKIYVWNMKNFQLSQILQRHTSYVYSLCISGNNLISSSKDQSILVWNTSTFQCECTIMCNQKSVMCVQAKGDLVLSSGMDSSISLRRIQNDKYSFELKGHQRKVLCLDFDEEQRFLASGSKDGFLVLWDYVHEYKINQIFAHDNGTTVVKFFNDKILSAGKDHLIKIWRIQDFIIGSISPLQILDSHTQMIRFVSFSNDLNFFISASDDKTIKLWDLKREKNTSFCGHSQSVTGCFYFNKYKNIVSSSLDGTLKIWNIQDQTLQQTIQAHSKGIKCLSINEQDQKLLTGSLDNAIKIWSLSNFGILGCLQVHENEIYCVKFVDDLIISCCRDKYIKIWSSVNFQIQMSIKHSHQVNCIAFDARLNRFIAGCCKGGINIWDIDKLRLINTQKSFQLIQNIFVDKKLEISKDHYFWYSSFNFLDLSISHIICYLDEPIVLQKYLEAIQKQSERIHLNQDYLKNTILDIANDNLTLKNLLSQFLIDEQNKSFNNCRCCSLAFYRFFKQSQNYNFLNISDFFSMTIQAVDIGQSNQFKRSDPEKFLYKCEYFSDLKFVVAQNDTLTQQQIAHTFPSMKPRSNIIEFQVQKVYIEGLLNCDSQDQIFLENIIIQSHDHTIFQNENLRDILDYKWNSYGFKIYCIQQMFLLQFVVAYTYNIYELIPRIYQSHFYDHESINLSILITFSSIIQIIIYLVVSLNQYYHKLNLSKNHPHITYLPKQKLIVAFLILFECCYNKFIVFKREYSKDDYSISKFLQALGFYLVMIESIRSLNGFKRYSFLIRLFSNLFGQILPFVSILFFLVWMFSVIEYITQNTQYPNSRFDSLRNSYRSLLGDFDDQFVNLQQSYSRSITINWQIIKLKQIYFYKTIFIVTRFDFLFYRFYKQSSLQQFDYDNLYLSIDQCLWRVIYFFDMVNIKYVISKIFKSQKLNQSQNLYKNMQIKNIVRYKIQSLIINKNHQLQIKQLIIFMNICSLFNQILQLFILTRIYQIDSKIILILNRIYLKQQQNHYFYAQIINKRLIFVWATFILMTIMFNLLVSVLNDQMDRAIGQKFSSENYEKSILLYDIDQFYIPIIKKIFGRFDKFFDQFERNQYLFIIKGIGINKSETDLRTRNIVDKIDKNLQDLSNLSLFKIYMF